LKSTFRKRNGFGVQAKDPKKLINDICRDTGYLTQGSIETYVESTRGEWGNDYPLRTPYRKKNFNPFRLVDILTLVKPENLNFTSSEHLKHKWFFIGQYGLWQLQVYIDNAGIHNFTVNVNVSGHWMFHPGQVKREIVFNSDEATYRDWKRFALADFDISLPILIEAASNKLPDFKAQSITTCDSSERLMRKCPKVEVYKKIAFLFL